MSNNGITIMNVSYKTRDGYLYAKVQGQFAPPRANEVTLGIVKTLHSHGLDKVLCDITSVDGFDDLHVTTITRFRVAEFVARAFPRAVRLSILESPQQLSNDRFGENVMLNRGVAVKVTTDLDEAIAWLA